MAQAYRRVRPGAKAAQEDVVGYLYIWIMALRKDAELYRPRTTAAANSRQLIAKVMKLALKIRKKAIRVITMDGPR